MASVTNFPGFGMHHTLGSNNTRHINCPQSCGMQIVIYGDQQASLTNPAVVKQHVDAHLKSCSAAAIDGGVLGAQKTLRGLVKIINVAPDRYHPAYIWQRKDDQYVYNLLGLIGMRFSDLPEKINMTNTTADFMWIMRQWDRIGLKHDAAAVLLAALSDEPPKAYVAGVLLGIHNCLSAMRSPIELTMLESILDAARDTRAAGVAYRLLAEQYPTENHESYTDKHIKRLEGTTWGDPDLEEKLNVMKGLMLNPADNFAALGSHLASRYGPMGNPHMFPTGGDTYRRDYTLTFKDAKHGDVLAPHPTWAVPTADGKPPVTLNEIKHKDLGDGLMVAEYYWSDGMTTISAVDSD